MILFAVVAPPRGGTMWYSRLFTTDRSYCFHQLTAILQPYPVNVVVEDAIRRAEPDLSDDAHRRLLLEAYPMYFSRHWERERYGDSAAGNSDGAGLALLPALSLAWPSMKFILSIRDGVKWVQSTLSCGDRLTAAELGIHDRDHADVDFFTFCCHQWVQNMRLIAEHRELLYARGADFVETSLEAMTTNERELRRVWDWLLGDWDLYAERNRSLMGRRLNPKADSAGVVPSDDVWRNWSAEQRHTFTEICGELQVGLGYTLPGDASRVTRSSARVTS